MPTSQASRICANSVPVFRTFLIKYLLFLQDSSASQAKNIFPNDAKFFTVILEHLTFHSGTKNLPILFHVIDTLKEFANDYQEKVF